MTIPPVGIERRVGQRFPYLLPLSLRQPGTAIEGVGCTQDLSSRGVFFFTNAPLTEGSEIELTLRMPSEITLGESMPVRCRGHILRIVRPSVASDHSQDCSRASGHEEQKIGVAVRLEGYEYLPESEATSTFSRVSSLHPQQQQQQNERPVVHSSPRPVLS